jgi:HEPN domain-containing protein
MPRAESTIVVAAWLAKADGDLGTTRTLLRDRHDTVPWAACFHAQQAAEKYLKAVLAAVGTEPPYSHNLMALHAATGSTIALPPDVDLATLTTYASAPRYAFSGFPDEPEPTWREAEAALGWATTVGRTVREWLGG